MSELLSEAQIAGVDFCGLRLPDKAEVLIKSRTDNTPLAGIVTYGEGKILAIGDSSFIADNTIDLGRSKFYKELIGWLTRESFFTKGNSLSRERSDEE